MPNDKPPTVSFNMWLSIQSGEFAPLRASWKTGRGRLTRQTVVNRAVEAGVSGDLAGRAFDAYCLAANVTNRDASPPPADPRQMNIPGTEEP